MCATGDKGDLQVTGALSEAIWSDLTEDAELGDSPSSSLVMKSQVTNCNIRSDMDDWTQHESGNQQTHTLVFWRLPLVSESEKIRGWTVESWVLTVSSTVNVNMQIKFKTFTLSLQGHVCCYAADKHYLAEA